MGSARLSVLAIAALLCGFSAPASVAADWKLVSSEAPIAGNGDVRETRWLLSTAEGASGRDVDAELDRIQLHRYRADPPTKAVLLYLPGTYMNGHASLTDAQHNLWLHLALKGIEVFALDYRTHFVPVESVKSPRDHAFMKSWTLEAFVADARRAAAQARKQSGHQKIFVGGFSRGATLAFGVACSEPASALAGLVVLDGPFKRATPGDFDLVAERKALFAKERFSNDVAYRIGWEARQRLMSAAGSNPSGPAFAKGFETVGEQLASILHGAWRPGGLADPVHGVSRVDVLARLLGGYDRYWPAIQNLEGRSIASRADDPNTKIDDAWGELSLPILYLGATNMGSDWILDGVYSAVKSGSEDVSLRVLEGYGHLDLLVGERAADEVYAPVTRWILDRSPQPAR